MIIDNIEGLSKGSHKLITAKCDFCGKTFKGECKRFLRSKNHFCNVKCHDYFRANAYEYNLSKQVGMNIKDFLYDKYVNELLTVRQLSLLLYENIKMTSSVLELLHRFNIPVRHGSEAIKIQWINNNERRIKTSNLAKKNLTTNEVRRKIATLVKTQDYHEKASASKQGKNNPMFGKCGSLHPRYNPNLTNEERKKRRNTSADKVFRLSVFERDNFICQKCGCVKGGNLEAHHILNHWKYKDLRYDVNNGITLCKKCHKNFHKKYGYKENNKEQIELWLK